MNTADSSLYIIIQARMTSTRLPKKVLLPLCDSTVLEVMLMRLSRYTRHIIIATTNDGSEEEIVALCNNANIQYYRGDTENVLSRYYEAAMEFGAQPGDTIVRLTSDCPLIDQNILEDMLIQFRSNFFDYYSNVFNRTYPRGLDIEIFTFDALNKAFHNAKTKFEIEHVTTFIHTTHQKEFKIGCFTDSKNNSKYRLTLDEEADYSAIKTVYKYLDCRTDFSYDELLKVLHANPQIYEINAHIEQKKQ